MELTQKTKGRKFQITALQKKTYAEPGENMDAAAAMLEHYEGPAPDFLLLPEMFVCPYRNSCFLCYAREGGGEYVRFLADLARAGRTYVIGGSVPELEDGKIYNTSFIFDRGGNVLARHRKVHLFDINVKGGQQYRESDVLSPGKDITVFDTEFGKMGVCVCFDIRFPGLFLAMRQAGVKTVFVPAAFNMTTGPAHWELLFRSRALDSQIYVAGCSPARDEAASYVAYGHSILTDPWGRIAASLDEKEGILSAMADMDLVDSVREQIPLGKVPEERNIGEQ